MRALVCDAITDDLSGVAIRELPVPSPGPGQALVRVAAASANFVDILLCQGKYQLKLEPPFTPGMNLVGEVVALGEGAVGEGAAGPAVGAQVVAPIRHGGFAEYALAEAASLEPLPAALSLAEAAAYPSAYLTAYVSLVRRANLQAGEVVLVHGASGGTGLATVDLAKCLGATVIASSASDAKLKVLGEYGADHLVNISGGFAGEVKALTDGRGADVIYDPVGGDVFDESTRCINFDGRLLVVGFTSGRFATARTNHALIKGYSIVGVRAGEYGRRFPERGRENRRAIWDLADTGKIRPRVHAELPFADVLTGFEMLRERAVIGKVVIRFDA
jgi:NADPH2:quinone reductase